MVYRRGSLDFRKFKFFETSVRIIDSPSSGFYKRLIMRMAVDNNLESSLERYSSAEIPTADGKLRVVVFRDHRHNATHTSSEHVALIVGDISQNLGAPSHRWTGGDQ